MPPKKINYVRPGGSHAPPASQMRLNSFAVTRAWIKVTSPQSLALDAFLSWRKTAIAAGATHLGHRVDDLPHAGADPENPLSLYLCFPTSGSADKWRDAACVRDTPFSSEMVHGREPSEAKAWRRPGGMDCRPSLTPAFASAPEALMILSQPGKPSEVMAASWQDALDLLRIPTVLNTVDGTIWIPVRNSEQAHNLRSSLLGDGNFQGVRIQMIQNISFQLDLIEFKVALIPSEGGTVRQLLEYEHTIFRNHLQRLFHSEYVTMDHIPNLKFLSMQTSVTFLNLSRAFRCVLAHGTHKRATHRLRWSFDTRLTPPSPPPDATLPSLQGESPRHLEHPTGKENLDSSSPIPVGKQRKVNLVTTAVASVGKVWKSVTRRTPSSPISIHSSPPRPKPSLKGLLGTKSSKKGKERAVGPVPTFELSSSPPRPALRESPNRLDFTPLSVKEEALSSHAVDTETNMSFVTTRPDRASESIVPAIDLPSSPPHAIRPGASQNQFQGASKRRVSSPEPPPRPDKKRKLDSKVKEPKEPKKDKSQTKAGQSTRSWPSASKRDWARVLIPTDITSIILLTPEEEEEARREIVTRIHEWYDTHKCERPSMDDIHAVTANIMESRQLLAVFYRARRSEATILELVTAILELQQEIGPATPTVYVCAVQVPKRRILDVVERLPNVPGHERKRIVAAMEGVYLDLQTKGYSDDYIVSFLYAGYTWMLSGRANFDLIHYQYEGPASEDKRTPFIVTGTVGGGAVNVDSSGHIELTGKAAWIHARREIIVGPNGEFKGFPIITRIPVFDILATPPHLRPILEALLAALLLPNTLNVHLGGLMRHHLDPEMVAKVKEANFPPNAFTEILFLGDATGRKGRSFPQSETGVLIMVMVTDYTGDPNPVIRMPDWHFDMGHESNDADVTKDEIEVIKAEIKPGDLVVVTWGTRVAEKNTRRHLFTGEVIPKKTRFFETSVVEILDVERVHLPFPHCGVLNYVGQESWIKDSYANSLPLLLLLGNESAKLKAQGLGRHPKAARMLLANCEVYGLFSFASKRLVGPGIRNLWDGAIVSAVGRHIEAGEAWSTVYSKVVEEIDRKLITALEKPSDPFVDSRNICCILKLPEDGSGGEIERKIIVPDGSGTVKELRIPKAWRGKKDFLGTLYLNPKSLHLQMVSSTGQMLRHPQEGHLFSIPRSHWLSTKTYAPEALEAHAESQGISTELSTQETIEISYRKSRAEEQSLRDRDSRRTGTKPQNNTSNANLRLVTTLDEKEILEGVANGGSHLHPLSFSYKFKLWNEDTKEFEPLHHRDPWTPLKFKGVLPKGIEWVAPFVDRVSKAWGFLLFECNVSTDWAPRFVRRAGMCNPGKKLFPIIHGPKSALYKKQFGTE